MGRAGGGKFVCRAKKILKAKACLSRKPGDQEGPSEQFCCFTARFPFLVSWLPAQTRKTFTGKIQFWISKRGISASLSTQPMNFAHFLRIERDERKRSKHFVVHTVDPKFSLELTPDTEAPDKVGRGIIKRICVPNSWAGDYGKYTKLLGAAQEFFAQSFAEPVAKAETRRFQA
jgi:hypothetical protein